MMTTPAPTPEEFLASIEPDDVDEGPQAPDPWTSPLESIAWSMQAIAQGSLPEPPAEDMVTREALDELARAYDALEEKYQAAAALNDRVLEVCKKSVSKLANEIREVLQPPASVEEPRAEGAVCPVHGWVHKFKTCEEVTEAPLPQQLHLEVPAHDAPVAEWRAYARRLGHGRTGPAFDELEAMNRSQIRTLLGIEQPAGGASA